MAHVEFPKSELVDLVIAVTEGESEETNQYVHFRTTSSFSKNPYGYLFVR